jgi:hypothetical protein
MPDRPFSETPEPLHPGDDYAEITAMLAAPGEVETGGHSEEELSWFCGASFAHDPHMVWGIGFCRGKKGGGPVGWFHDPTDSECAAGHESNTLAIADALATPRSAGEAETRRDRGRDAADAGNPQDRPAEDMNGAIGGEAEAGGRMRPAVVGALAEFCERPEAAALELARLGLLNPPESLINERRDCPGIAPTPRSAGEVTGRPGGDEFDQMVSEERLILAGTELVTGRLADLGVKRSELARRMGKSKATVTHLLSGERSMTLRSLARMMHHLGAEVSLTARPFHVPTNPGEDWNATPHAQHLDGWRVGVYREHHRVGSADFAYEDDAAAFHAFVNGTTPSPAPPVRPQPLNENPTLPERLRRNQVTMVPPDPLTMSLLGEAADEIERLTAPAPPVQDGRAEPTETIDEGTAASIIALAGYAVAASKGYPEAAGIGREAAAVLPVVAPLVTDSLLDTWDFTRPPSAPRSPEGPAT